MNRYIAADSFVNDVLPGVGIENKPSEKKLVARNWTEENGIYARVCFLHSIIKYRHILKMLKIFI